MKKVKEEEVEKIMDERWEYAQVQFFYSSVHVCVPGDVYNFVKKKERALFVTVADLSRFTSATLILVLASGFFYRLILRDARPLNTTRYCGNPGDATIICRSKAVIFFFVRLLLRLEWP